MEYIAKKAVSALGDLLYTIKQVEALLLRFLAPLRVGLAYFVLMAPLRIYSLLRLCGLCV